jgi:hypothetical protein
MKRLPGARKILIFSFKVITPTQKQVIGLRQA